MRGGRSGPRHAIPPPSRRGTASSAWPCPTSPAPPTGRRCSPASPMSSISPASRMPRAAARRALYAASTPRPWASLLRRPRAARSSGSCSCRRSGRKRACRPTMPHHRTRTGPRRPTPMGAPSSKLSGWSPRAASRSPCCVLPWSTAKASKAISRRSPRLPRRRCRCRSPASTTAARCLPSTI